jgi:hypothetical protein
MVAATLNEWIRKLEPRIKEWMCPYNQTRAEDGWEKSLTRRK